jgi:putative RecB family exonuclease
VPSEQSVRGLSQRAGAIWVAVSRACDTDNFPPKPSALCDWCSFRAFCPAQGGDPALGQAAIEAARAQRQARQDQGLAAAV